ncbi:MAG TPA: hypothetical protein VF850_02755 [Gemmatimonadaceae bacterium]
MRTAFIVQCAGMKADASVVQRRQMETGEQVGTNLISAAIDASN